MSLSLPSWTLVTVFDALVTPGLRQSEESDGVVLPSLHVKVLLEDPSLWISAYNSLRCYPMLEKIPKTSEVTHLCGQTPVAIDLKLG